MYKPSFTAAFLAALLSFSADTAYGWHGKTHKFLAERSVSFLVDQDEREFYNQYNEDLLKGVEEADKNYGNMRHHVTFGRDGKVKRDTGPAFAQDVGEEAIEIIQDARKVGEVTEEERARFAELAGYVVHVISDMNAFHVIWGEDQKLHNKYEKDVDDTVIVADNGDFESQEFKINFDGTLREDVDPYSAVMEIAEASYFGDGSILPAREIERRFKKCGLSKCVRKSTERILTKATNVAAEVLDYMYKRAFLEPVPPEYAQNNE